VPSRIIDLMVAVSNPRAFAINALSRQGERLPATRSDGVGTAPDGYVSTYDPVCYDPMFMYSYNCGVGGYGYGFGSDYGYGWNPGGVTIIYGGSSGGGSSGGGSRPHGRVVNGTGYVKGDDGPSTQALPRPPADSRPASGSTSGSSGTGTQSTSSGTTEQRTAKPRPH